VTTAIWLYNPIAKVRNFIEKRQEMVENINAPMKIKDYLTLIPQHFTTHLYVCIWPTERGQEV
jgi:hypothetical protein